MRSCYSAVSLHLGLLKQAGAPSRPKESNREVRAGQPKSNVDRNLQLSHSHGSPQHVLVCHSMPRDHWGARRAPHLHSPPGPPPAPQPQEASSTTHRSSMLLNDHCWPCARSAKSHPRWPQLAQPETRLHLTRSQN
ncbi:hypothetical protein NDU88_007640 [Pleurodeles waltl]|uniref:Uncharacterized protein n=1 Tax=Pleurodeles waltl TaxID=8319 RepID=A0AAV7RSZ7_PLEWA|nr:hypothetical protein NDU88_007640 [Pleurodeles waltl]